MEVKAQQEFNSFLFIKELLQPYKHFKKSTTSKTKELPKDYIKTYRKNKYLTVG